MRIRRDVDDAIALLDAERLQRGRPAIAALEEVAVREALRAVDNGLARRIQATRAPGELERGKGNLQETDSIEPLPSSSTRFRALVRLRSSSLHVDYRRDLMAWLQLLLLLLIVAFLPGCAIAGGIFKAGAWVGALAVILVIAVIGFIVAKVAS